MSGPEVVTVSTGRRCEMIDVTDEVIRALGRLGLEQGHVMVGSPHTTAAVTVNEGADPDVCTDILAHLERLVPRRPDFQHVEGNSDSHIKVALLGPSQLLAVDGGRPVLGSWQRIFLCEFDGPRTRRLHVSALSGP